MLPAEKCHRWAGALLIWAMLVGCETRQPMAATREDTHATVVSKPILDTVSPRQPMPLDTSVSIDNQPSKTEDVAALHKPFEVIHQVIPGLLVVINSIRPADTAIIRDRGDLKVVLTIKRSNTVIYRDTTADGWAYDLNFMPLDTRKLYPLWIPIGQGDGDLLVAFSNRPAKELARRFHIRNDRVAKIDTLLTFNGPAKDWDKDGKLEYAGALDNSQLWDDEHGQRFITYDPTLYYEITSTGLALDTALTKRKVREEYGVFKGFKPFEEPGFLMSKLPKGSHKRL